MANNTDGRWITVNGTHIFIKNGQSVGDAFKATTGKVLKGEGIKDDDAKILRRNRFYFYFDKDGNTTSVTSPAPEHKNYKLKDGKFFGKKDSKGKSAKEIVDDYNKIVSGVKAKKAKFSDYDIKKTEYLDNRKVKMPAYHIVSKDGSYKSTVYSMQEAKKQILKELKRK